MPLPWCSPLFDSRERLLFESQCKGDTFIAHALNVATISFTAKQSPSSPNGPDLHFRRYRCFYHAPADDISFERHLRWALLSSCSKLDSNTSILAYSLFFYCQGRIYALTILCNFLVGIPVQPAPETPGSIVTGDIFHNDYINRTMSGNFVRPRTTVSFTCDLKLINQEPPAAEPAD